MISRCSPSGEYHSRSCLLLLNLGRWRDGGKHHPPSSYLICLSGLWVHILFVILGCHQFEWNPSDLLNLLTTCQGNSNFDGTFPLPFRILEDGDIQSTFVHLLESIGRGIYTTDKDLAQFASGFNGLNGANCHFVIVRSDSINLVARGKPILH